MKNKVTELKKLANAKSDLDSFRKNYPLFYFDLLIFLSQYIDEYMISRGFSLKLRTVFRVFLEQHDETEYQTIMDADKRKTIKQLDELFIKHLDCYSKFAEMIRYHVFNNGKGLGYSKITRLIFGEPVISVFIGSTGFKRAYKLCEAITVNGLDEDIIREFMIEQFDELINILYKIEIIEGNGDEIAS